MPPRPTLPRSRAEALRRPLAAWFRRARRDLPWRAEPRDGWAVLVSEVMLQQTRVEVVAPRFRAFLDRWPTPAAMAAAPEDAVLAAWSGLGYYRRAVHLHRAARAVVDRHGGEMPRDLDALRALPGVGEYTAAAVGSLALGLRAPLVDGNVARVLSRLFAVRGDPRRGAAAARVRALAAALVPRNAGPWNEALMELGALVCIPARPRCGDCPLTRECVARGRGLQDRLPELAARKPSRPLRLAAGLVSGPGGTLLLRRPAGGLLGGTWELPHAEVHEGEDPRGCLSAALAGRLGGRWTVGPLAATVRHSILDRRITLEAYPVLGKRPRAGRGAVYACAETLAGLPVSSLVGKVLRGAAKGDGRN